MSLAVSGPNAFPAAAPGPQGFTSMVQASRPAVNSTAAKPPEAQAAEAKGWGDWFHKLPGADATYSNPEAAVAYLKAVLRAQTTTVVARFYVYEDDSGQIQYAVFVESPINETIEEADANIRRRARANLPQNMQSATDIPYLKIPIRQDTPSNMIQGQPSTRL